MATLLDWARQRSPIKVLSREGGDEVPDVRGSITATRRR